MLEREHIFIYGPPGSGKSYLGSRLAQILGLPFIDLDQEIEREAGVAISEIFSASGEGSFRRQESEQLKKVSQCGKDSVVALGGGTLLTEENQQLVESSGRVICLHADESTIVRNLDNHKNTRPLLAGDFHSKLRILLEQRAEHYNQFSHVDVRQRSEDQILNDLQIESHRFNIQGMGKPYAVRLQPGSLDRVGKILQDSGLRGPILIVSDRNVYPLYGRQVELSLQQAGFVSAAVVLEPGEKDKNLAAIQRIWDGCVSAGMERASTILALGGGVVSDLAGFAASSYMRGIAWVAYPTSLLAMVDASLGGKTGFDLPQGKNLIGAFYAPTKVLVDPNCLASLPISEVRNGMAEVLKHGIIADPSLVELCRSGRWHSNLVNLLPKAMAVKIKILCADPYEKGQRAVLNFGHTVGHAIELVSGFRLRHGEAVGLGMLAEAQISVQLGLAEPELPAEIALCLKQLGLPVSIPGALPIDAILAAMQKDKKIEGGRIKFAIPQRVGRVDFGIEVEIELVRSVIMQLMG